MQIMYRVSNKTGYDQKNTCEFFGNQTSELKNPCQESGQFKSQLKPEGKNVCRSTQSSLRLQATTGYQNSSLVRFSPIYLAATGRNLVLSERPPAPQGYKNQLEAHSRGVSIIRERQEDHSPRWFFLMRALLPKLHWL